MQSLEVISVNIWQILISLCNLLIIFLIIKKFLFKPVKKAMDNRDKAIKEQYASASAAEKSAMEDKASWEQKLRDAQNDADEIIDNATRVAKRRGDEIVAEAHSDAEGILRRAKNDAALEVKKAEDTIRREIVDVSSAISEKIIGREINEADHKDIIDAFIGDLGENDDGRK